MQGGGQAGARDQVASQGSRDQNSERSGTQNPSIGIGLSGPNPNPCSFPECCSMQGGGQADARGQVANLGAQGTVVLVVSPNLGR